MLVFMCLKECHSVSTLFVSVHSQSTWVNEVDEGIKSRPVSMLTRRVEIVFEKHDLKYQASNSTFFNKNVRNEEMPTKSYQKISGPFE